MKNILFIFFSCICCLTLRAQSCDSIRLVLNSFSDNANVTWHTLEIDTLQNQQIVSSTVNFWDPVTQTFSGGSTSYIQWDTIGNQIHQYVGILQLTYEYDSFGRLIALDSASFDGTNWITYSNIDYYFTSMGTDSLKLRYGFVNSVFMLAEKISWTYDSLDRIVQKVTEGYVNNVWQVVEDTRTDYSSILPSVVRVDSVYLYNSSSLVLTSVYAYSYNTNDSASYTIFDYPFDIMFPSYTYYIWNECGHTQWEYTIIHSGRWEYADFDSLCRYTHFESGSASMSMGRQSDCYDYYYIDCNSMIGFIFSDKNKICGGDTVQLAMNIYGGTPPYSYQWISGGAIGNDSVSHPFANPAASASYICTVTDSNFNTWTDTVFIHVDPLVTANLYLLSIDTTGPCSSADLATTLISGTSFYWYEFGTGNMYSNNDTILHAVYNGVYVLERYSGVCPVQSDTFNLTQLMHPSPFVSIEEGCNQLMAHSSSPSTFEWFMNSDPDPIFYSDTFNLSISDWYGIVATDSAGCSSEMVGQYYRHYSISPNFIHACNDSCFGEASVTVLPYFLPYSYLWTNGDTTSYADSLCNGIIGVTVTNHLGCQLTEIDSCLNISVPEINFIDQQILSVYPNPSDGVYSLSSTDKSQNTENISVRIFNLIGEEMFFSDFQQLNSARIDISSKPDGIYFLEVVIDEKRIVKKVIKG